MKTLQKLKKNPKLGGFLLLFVSVATLSIYDNTKNSCVLKETRNEQLLRLFCSKDFTDSLSESQLNNFSQTICLQPSQFPECSLKASCSQAAFVEVSNFIEDNPLFGILSIVLAYSVGSLFLPGSFLTLTSSAAVATAFPDLSLGVVVLLGTACVWGGAMIGSSIAFCLGRFVFRSYAISLKKNYKVLEVIDLVIEDRGQALKVTLLLRLSPVVPFVANNFILGTTAMDFDIFVTGTAFGIIPGTAAYVFIGVSIARALVSKEKEVDGTLVLDDTSCETKDTSSITNILLVVGAIATVLAVGFISRYARKEWIRIRDQAKNKPDEEKVEFLV
eukprot:augustus_masked-scaffold_7-processed-gene-5.15-mRNA-1 protein AED:0.26 eAED:0.27 QI:0/-1/0/1/-1/1/1/0/331